MAPTPALDLDLVRTLIFIGEEGSFTRAAERVGRTLSAVSLQVQRLEAIVGHSLVSRTKGGAVELTARGKALAERGRELLAFNDDILHSLNDLPDYAEVRLGVDEAFTRRCLPDILSRFAATHPTTAVDVWRATPTPATRTARTCSVIA